MKNGTAGAAEKTVPVVAPHVSIYETEKEFGLEAEMPGLLKDDIRVEVEQDELVLGAKRKIAEEEDKDLQPLHKERFSLEYQSRFILGSDVDKQGIRATYENGLLKVMLPKAQKAQPKKIVIL